VSASEPSLAAGTLALCHLGDIIAAIESRHILGVHSPEEALEDGPADLARFFGVAPGWDGARHLLRLRVEPQHRLLLVGERVQMVGADEARVHPLPRLLDGLPQKTGIVDIAFVQGSLTYLVDPPLLFACWEASAA
jgi:hypothetical protein